MKAVSHTCLYTDEPLSGSTKIEHTIPRVLGGRWKSSLVTSSHFNNLAGQRCDPILVDTFRYILLAIGPLIPRENRYPGYSFTDPGDGRLTIEPGMILRCDGDRVVERDAQNRPKRIIGDTKRWKKWAEKQGGSLVELPPVAAPAELRRNTGSQLISPAFEMSCFRVMLTTWDMLLIDHPVRFTRHPTLARIRSSIRDWVVREDETATVILDQNVWGIDLSIQQRINQLLFDATSVAVSPFEHIMIASANPARRTLDLVWSIFGFEPFRVRIPLSFECAAFTHIARCPVLKDSFASIQLDTCLPFELGPMNFARSRAPAGNANAVNDACMIVGTMRLQKQVEAQHLVILKSDATVETYLREKVESLKHRVKPRDLLIKSIRETAYMVCAVYVDFGLMSAEEFEKIVDTKVRAVKAPLQRFSGELSAEYLQLLTQGYRSVVNAIFEKHPSIQFHEPGSMVLSEKGPRS